jgi:hypothetical protein
MDELELRRRLYADPHSQDEALLAALNDDAKKLQQELQALDSELNKAFDVAIPEGLEQRLVLNQSLHAFRQQKRKNRIHLALAASIAFSFGIAFSYWQSPEPLNLEQHALAHVYHELGALSNGNNEFALAQVNAKLASFGGQFNELPAKVSYVTYCHFNGQKALHMIFQSSAGPITVFVVPGSNQFETDSWFSDERFDGQIFQTQKANLIMVGEKGANMDNYKEALNKNILWQT